MSEALSVTLDLLVKLGKLDAQIAKQSAEKKRLLALEGEIEKIIGSLKLETADIERRCNERKAVFHKEETNLQVEKQKLVERRKSLSTLGDYKLQSAAEREIEHSSRQLTKQEERVQLQTEEVEKLAALLAEKNQILEDKTAAGQRMLAEAMDRVSVLDQELADLNKRRAEQAVTIDKPTMVTYQRSFNRNPNDPVVALKGPTCGGCFINLGPQTIGEVANARSIVTCRSCGRILFMAPDQEQGA